jgi:sulfite oxidase
MARGYQRGVVAAVPATVGASLLAVVAGWPTPLEAVAETLMAYTPLPIADFLLAHVGTVARPLALLGALALVMLLGGIGGALQALPGCGLIREVGGYLASAGLLAVVLLHAIPPVLAAPDLVLVLLFVPCLAVVRTRWGRVDGRREFLERSAVILGGAAAVLALLSLEPTIAGIAARKLFPFRKPAGLRVAGITDLVTAPQRFYVMDKVLEAPTLQSDTWKLPVRGLVDRPLELDYTTLLTLPRTNRYITCECVDNTVGGEKMSTAYWSGVPVTYLLNRVGARGDAVVFHGADVYDESIPVAELREADAFIAFGMNGETLPRRHGYPARLILPGVYGFKSVKWLTGMTVVRGHHAQNWEAQGWSDDATIHTTTRIDVAAREGEKITVAGVAFAGRRGVSAVEVRVNGGPWRHATLGPVLSHETWAQWAITLRGHGTAAVEARAIDGTGAVQTGQVQPSYPDGATGWATATV